MMFQAQIAANNLLIELKLTTIDWDNRIPQFNISAGELPNLDERTLNQWFKAAMELLRVLTDNNFHLSLIEAVKPAHRLAPASTLRDDVRDALKDAYRSVNGLQRKRK